MNKYRFYIQNAIILFLCSAFVLPAAADQMYKWVDERGRVTYQSSPPPDDAAEVERPAISTTANDAADEPTKEVAGEVTEEVTEEVADEVADEVAEEAAENEVVSITFFQTLTVSHAKIFEPICKKTSWISKRLILLRISRGQLQCRTSMAITRFRPLL